jgi:A/G-specific adenine glycosylase
MPKKHLQDQKKRFNKILLQWVKKNGRDFFWREKRDAYKVFIAEFLLKRTTCTAAHRVYQKFLEQYPDILKLASANLEDLEKILKPIGLYKQRAKGIKEAAEFLVENFGGNFPRKFEELLHVPHIGTYTAACILSFGLDIPVPAIDSNGQRIISRFFKNELSDNLTLKKVLEFSWDLVPKKDHALFNYGLIDMGAMVCSYRGCSKEDCPLNKNCDFYQSEKGSTTYLQDNP